MYTFTYNIKNVFIYIISSQISDIIFRDPNFSLFNSYMILVLFSVVLWKWYRMDLNKLNIKIANSLFSVTQ